MCVIYVCVYVHAMDVSVVRSSVDLDMYVCMYMCMYVCVYVHAMDVSVV
jgi:hypothetical protein